MVHGTVDTWPHTRAFDCYRSRSLTGPSPMSLSGSRCGPATDGAAIDVIADRGRKNRSVRAGDRGWTWGGRLQRSTLLLLLVPTQRFMRSGDGVRSGTHQIVVSSAASPPHRSDMTANFRRRSNVPLLGRRLGQADALPGARALLTVAAIGVACKYVGLSGCVGGRVWTHHEVARAEHVSHCLMRGLAAR
jgi:hypothetical protein